MVTLNGNVGYVLTAFMITNAVLDALRNRRSCRKYESRQIDPDLIDAQGGEQAKPLQSSDSGARYGSYQRSTAAGNPVASGAAAAKSMAIVRAM